MNNEITNKAKQDQSNVLLGQCVEIGTDETGQPRLVIDTTRDAIACQERSLTFKNVVVILGDEIELAEVAGFDGQAQTVTFRFDAMPCAAIGEILAVRAKEVRLNHQ